MFNLYFLKVFVSVAETKSFRKAALANSISQSAVSQQIRVLENTLKTTLIERSGKKLYLTDTGKVFLTYAQSIVNQADEALVAIEKQGDTCNGVIKVATIYSVGLYKLQSKIRLFLKKHPDVEVHLEYHHNDAIYDMLANRKIDFGFVSFPNNKIAINSEIFFEDQLVLIQSTQRPIFKKRKIDLKNMHQAKYITLSPTTPTGKKINSFLESKSVSPHIVGNFENIETLKSAALVGMGCAIVPKYVLMNELKQKQIEIVSVKGMSLTRPIGILHLKGKNFGKSCQKFHEMFTC